MGSRPYTQRRNDIGADMTHTARSAPTSRLGLKVSALIACLVLAACGSRVDPDTVAAANGQGEVGSSTVAGASGLTGTSAGSTGILPGSVPGGSVPEGSVPGGSVSDGAGPGTPTGDGPGGGSDAGDQDGTNSANGGVQHGACDGLKNADGITDDKIIIGNASDISGPVPGLFQQTQDAVRAYVAYFNATSDICGRKLELRTYDSRTDASADQQAYTKGCDEVFAMVGSASAFDSGGAATAEQCGLPDVRTNSLTQERNNCSTCFGANSTNARQFENIVPDTIIKDYGGGQHAAMLYINAGAASENGHTQAKAGTERGMNYLYESGIDIAEFNYAPYVKQMKDKGVQSLQFIANDAIFVRMAQAMKQQGFTPKVVMLDPSAYTSNFVESGGDDVEGTVVFMNFTPFEEAAKNAELRLYMSWLQQVNPSARPGFFGVFAWSAARLFVQTAIELGGQLDRKTLVSAITKVNDWSANGIHAPQRVGSKQVSDCWRFIKLVNGKWVPVGGTGYRCSGVTTVS